MDEDKLNDEEDIDPIEILRQAIEAMRMVIDKHTPEGERPPGIAIMSDNRFALIVPEPESPIVLDMLRAIKKENVEVIALNSADVHIGTGIGYTEMLEKTLRESMATFVLHAHNVDDPPFIFEKNGGRRRRRKRSQWNKQRPWE